MKLTDEQKQAIDSAHKEARVAFEWQPINSETLFEIQTFFQQRLPFISKVVCNNSNNTPETIDRGIVIVLLGDDQITIGYDLELSFEDDGVKAVRSQVLERSFKVHHDDQPNEVMDEVAEALGAFGLEVTEEFNDGNVTYTIRQKTMINGQ